ncbi:MAG: oligoendopeptidase F, partial [Lysobacterales bacterium]
MSTHDKLLALPRYKERSFVAQDADLLDIKQLKGYYQILTDCKVESDDMFEKWVLDRSELDSVLDQVGSVLYIDMTCQTDDKAKAQAYQDFTQNIVPVVMPLEDELNKKFLKLNEKFNLDEERYKIYTREIKADVELFNEKNVDLRTQVELLSQEYQTIMGAMTVEFDGIEKTMPEMSKYLLETDRDLRERAWKAVTARRLQDTDKLDDIFDQMIKLRHEISQNAGCKNFAEYKFRSLHRFDYTVEDCKKYHQAMEECVLPLYTELVKKDKVLLGLDEFRPWDTAVDPMGRAPLKPFEKDDQLINGVKKIFDKVDGELAAYFKEMKDAGCLDLASRKGKAPGGYQSSLNEARKPFIFMNAVGLDGDVNTLLHEAGHAFHTFLSAHDPLSDYRHAPMEFCEVASMAMELLGAEHLSEFYNSEDEKRSVKEHLEDILFVLIWVATIDSFQHWIYDNPTHTREERTESWLATLDRFSPNLVNWDGF